MLGCAEIDSDSVTGGEMYVQRKVLWGELETLRESRVLAYITGDRPGLETQMHPEVYDLFVKHLDAIGATSRLSLFLYTRGGATLAAWSLVNLIRQFCQEFEVIVPSKAHSAGTLVCLGADRIVMTKQATLGPVDPSVNTPLNPSIPGAAPDARVPVSVEAIKGFIELARSELGIKRADQSAAILSALAEKIHPLVLGEVYRARSQIQMLARRLVARQVKRRAQADAVVNFLCSDSGSHDYTVHRREARDTLGLEVDKPDDVLYSLIKKLYDDIEAELQLTSRFDPNTLLGKQPTIGYEFRRALVESIPGGSHNFVSEGQLARVAISGPGGVQQQGIQDVRTFEGWRHDNA